MRKIIVLSALSFATIFLVGCGATQTNQKATVPEVASSVPSVQDSSASESSTSKDSNAEDDTMTVELTMDNVNDYCEVVLVENKLKDAFGEDTGETEKIWLCTSKAFKDGWVLTESNCVIRFASGDNTYDQPDCLGPFEQIGIFEYDTKPEITKVKGTITFTKYDKLEEYSMSDGNRSWTYQGNGRSETGFDKFAAYPY